MSYDLSKLTPDIRSLNDVRSVLFDRNFAEKSADAGLYFMYRGLEEKDGLRFDVTVIPSRMLGSEFVKTKGHKHVGEYKEVYIVIEGEAIFLMQKTEGEIVEDVYAVKAKKGQAVIIPSFYGHVTINPSKEDLKMANWISSECKSNYELFEEKAGACYYCVLSESGEPEWVKNPNYNSVPDLRFEQPSEAVPENLNFLK